MKFVFPCAALLIYSQPALACSCSPIGPTFLPADGSLDVPTNAVPTVIFYETQEFELRRNDDDEFVPAEVVWTQSDGTAAYGRIHPLQNLDPDTHYYFQIGPDRSDFTTGTQQDNEAPETPVMGDIMGWNGIKTCGGSIVVSTCQTSGVSFKTTSSAKNLVETFVYVNGNAETGFSVLTTGAADIVLGDFTCSLSTHPDMRGIQTMTFKSRTLDLAGNTSEWTEKKTKAPKTAEPDCGDSGCTSSPAPPSDWALLLGLVAFFKRARCTTG